MRGLLRRLTEGTTPGVASDSHALPTGLPRRRRAKGRDASMDSVLRLSDASPPSHEWTGKPKPCRGTTVVGPTGSGLMGNPTPGHRRRRRKPVVTFLPQTTDLHPVASDTTHREEECPRQQSPGNQR